MKNISFKKSGKEIKTSIDTRCEELEERLSKRNIGLEEILNDRAKVRSYMLRQGLSQRRYEYENPPIVTKNDISSEEIEEISQMCRRISEIEQEINKLRLIQAHLSDKEIFEIELKDLIRYGFKVE